MTDSANSDQLITDANKAFYAQTAAEYDNIGRGAVVQVAKTNTANILSYIASIDPASTEIMEFAAGTGIVAMLLAPRCKTVYAVDQSAEMIEQLRKKLQDPSNKVRNIVPVVTDILKPGKQEVLEGKKFDVITCTNSYHHISDPARLTQVLATYLKPRGYLAVVDLIKTEESAEFHKQPFTQEQHDGSHKQVVDFSANTQQHAQSDGQHHHIHTHAHSHDHVIAHVGGFTQSDMEAFFTPAKLELIYMGKSSQFIKDGKAYDNFLAIAQKAS